MSWNGSIPRKKKGPKGLRNKRKQKSPKAILAKQEAAAKRAAMRPERYGRDPSNEFG